MNYINRIFRLEEINGGERCPTYLYRWTLLSTRWFKIYLHHFVGDDWTSDLHDHPKRFVTIGLRGRYIEESPALNHTFQSSFNGHDRCAAPLDAMLDSTSADPIRCRRAVADHIKETTYNAPWVRTFPATHAHRLKLFPGESCWTIAIVFKTIRPWGFWHDGRWIPWRRYVGSEMAEKMKTCGER